MDNPTPFRRRWLQFGLRTFFIVVTIFSMFLGWLGLEWTLVRERKEYLAQTPAVMILTVDEVQAEMASPTKSPRVVITSDRVPTFGGERSPQAPTTPSQSSQLPTIPFWRQWMGDKAISVIALSDPDQTEAQRLFPEATVFSFGK